MIELRTTENHLPELLRRLDEIWQIEEPLLQRSIYHGRNGRQSVLDVVIRKDGERRVIALCDDVDVERFLRQRQLAVLEV